jgi:uncharacterized membrane protein YphA (DoxX/SURF4 family)
LLGLVFLVSGLNFFLGLFPLPAPPEGNAALFFTGLMASGYLMPLVKVFEVSAAVLLLSNRFVPLSLVLLAPILVNIAAVHFLLEPSYGLAIGLLTLELFLAFTHRKAYAGLFHARNETRPESDSAPASRAAASAA